LQQSRYKKLHPVGDDGWEDVKVDTYNLLLLFDESFEDLPE